MKVTYNWLKDFVNIKIPAQDLADKLTMAGLEVTALEKKEGDYIFEIEITSNRPDWLSVIGIAREVAAITNSKLIIQSSTTKDKIKKSEKYRFAIAIQDKKDCPLYTAKIIRDVKVGPSPEWLKKRVELIGLRSINNVVDITNYVLFETGEPLHAFDLDKLAKEEIIVRRARNSEKILTIDGLERTLTQDMLVIADAQKAIALAGVIGGKNTEVTESTKNILLEAAIFNPVVIRRARQRLGIQTDSSYRFERGIDAQTVQSASSRAAQLIEKLAFGKLVLAKNTSLSESKKKIINLNNSAVSKILGVQILAAKTKSILANLGFSVKPQTKNKFSVGVPAWRGDINLEIDLIEEVARVFGYENIPAKIAAVKPAVVMATKRDRISMVKNIMIGLGLNEAITYSLMDKDLLANFSLGRDFKVTEVLNPLSKEQEALRPSILPGLCNSIARNINQKQEYVNLFEVAHIFSAGKDSPEETDALAIALSGRKTIMLKQGAVEDEAGLLHIKGILETLFSRLGIKEYSFKIGGPGSVATVNITGEMIGVMARLPKNALDKLDIKNRNVFVAEILLEKVLASANLNKRLDPLPKYPGIERDLSIVIKEGIAAGEVIDIIRETGAPLLRQANVTDYYRGKQIPDGHKGLTISCSYRSDDRTLTELEVMPLHNQICNILMQRLGAKMR